MNVIVNISATHPNVTPPATVQKQMLAAFRPVRPNLSVTVSKNYVLPLSNSYLLTYKFTEDTNRCNEPLAWEKYFRDTLSEYGWNVYSVDVACGGTTAPTTLPKSVAPIANITDINALVAAELAKQKAGQSAGFSFQGLADNLKIPVAALALGSIAILLIIGQRNR